MKTAMEMENEIKARADEDPAFRARLMDDPKAVIEEVTGLDVPDAINVHVHEESATDLHLVLPPMGGRLSDEEMRDATGGFSGQAW
ncbi:MAG: NHLP leader peptide family RiPP precursor [Rhodobacter sp.]|nr:NHLP leader peptide family RiPP precursor [Rhodobacter sp.]MCY4242856.1 NHLP leader peptide family RiPP precursor [Rhodobacter sp.]